MTAVGRTDRGPDRRYLVLGLEGPDPEFVPTGQLMEDVGSGSDRVAAEKQWNSRLLRCGDEAPRQSGVAVDVGIGAGFLAGRCDCDHVAAQLGRLSVGVAGPESRRVRGDHGVATGELLVDPFERRVSRPGVHPRHQAEREEVLRPLGVARLHPEGFADLTGQAGHRNLDDRISVEAAVIERVVDETCLLEVAVVEGILVDDEGASWHEPVEV